MTILSVVPNVTGDVGIVPRIVRINTNDTVSTILSVGYCNNVPLQFGVNFTTADMILVASTDQGTDWYELDPAQPGITLKVASESDGNILGPTPASSTTNAIVRWTSGSGRNIKNSVAILDNTGSLSGLNIVSANAYIADLFQTRAGGEVSFSNPLGTFSTSFKAGANIADTEYTWPTAFPTVNGQVMTCSTAGVMTWTTNGAGDVVGPASATDTAIALFDGTSGKLLKNSAALISGGVSPSMTGLTNISITGSYIGNSFTTLAGGFFSLRNAGDTHSTTFNAAAITVDQNYVYPLTLPTLNDQPMVSSTAGVMRWAAAIVVEQITQASSVTMTRNKSYTSTNSGSRSTFTMPTSGFSVGDIFRVVGEGSAGWEFAVSGTMNIDAAGFGLTAGDKIQSTLYSDIAYVICTDATPGDEQFSLVIERGAFTLPTQSVVINSETEIPPIEVTTTSQTVVPGRTYFANNASLVTFTIPGTWPFGAWFAIDGKGLGKWRVQANGGQTIRAFGASTTSGGTLTATGQDDTIKIRCLTANILFTCEAIGGAGVITA